MISRINYALKYIHYLLFAKHKKGHGIHSPFVFKLITEVFTKKEIEKPLLNAFEVYSQYKNSNEKIVFTDLGAGSKYSNEKSLPLKRIIKNSGLPEKYGRLLYNLVKYINPNTILELGTSVGISTIFIGSAAKNATFTTIEASESKLNKAKELAEKLELKNITFVKGDFDIVLDPVLQNFNQLDFVFIDGNHRLEPTLKYFHQCLTKAHNNSVFIFDDIHWSDEMEKAWDEIKRNPKVRVSIDIFRMGIVFFQSELSYQHYVIKF
jgi:predicted O-methyltransferase YrrM